MINKQVLIDRFIKYIKIDTQSDPENPAFPSTEKQWVLAKLLEKELKDIGLKDVVLDENCYLMATLPSNCNKKLPTIGFISHIDTSPDFTATNVQPQIIYQYDGKDIILNKEENIILSPSEFKDLLQYKGQTIITTNGKTLLGADDKAGVAEIVTAMEYLVNNPSIKHGEIKVCFTPDEEVGKGAHLFDVQKFNADWAYTMDGSKIGELEFENFNAASAKITIKGKIVHPGYAKNKMINAITIANKFISRLPANEVPEKTVNYQGFYHLHKINGNVDETILEYIIRDHDSEKFKERKSKMMEIANQLNIEFGKELVIVELKDQYYNMREKIEPVYSIVDIAKDVMLDLGIKPLIKPIRGGTDGSQLSFKGLPCPNIFAGGHNFHSRFEYVPVESMVKAVEVIIGISQKVTSV